MSAPISLEIFAGFALFALVFAPLERWFPQHGLPLFRRGWAMDVVYYVLGCVVGRLSDAVSLGAALLIRHSAHVGPGFAARQPGWLQFIEILLVADFLAYWFHRALHTFPILWRLHRVHHTSEAMDWLANVRLHPVDKFLGDCFQFIPLFALGFSDGPMLVYTLVLGFQGFLNHSNIRLNIGPLRWIIATPEFHHWHHCKDPVYYNKNFAPHFVIFDRLFGSIYLSPTCDRPKAYGILETLPDNLAGHMVSPFVPDARLRAVAASAAEGGADTGGRGPPGDASCER